MSDHLGEHGLAYVLGTLTDVQRGQADEHLASCPICQADVDRLRRATGALATWPRDPALPFELTERIVARAHLAGPRPRRARPAWLQTAALVLLMLATGYAGFQLGAWRAQPQGAQTALDSLPQFLLLLEERAWPDASSALRSGYSDWALSVRRSGRMISAEKLADEPGWRMLSNGQLQRPEHGERPANVSGWFLVRAESYDSAFAWVRRGPHLRYGTVLVRQVE
jgi:hypothetical protein